MDSNASDSTVATIGIDIGKNTFQLVGLDECGSIVLRRKLSRGQVVVRLANMPPCLVGMEACVGAHHLSRQLLRLGHDVKLMPGHKRDREKAFSAILPKCSLEEFFNTICHEPTF